MTLEGGNRSSVLRIVTIALSLAAVFCADLHVAYAVTQTDTYTTLGAGTWTAPAGVTSVQAEVWAGGGGGGGSNGTNGAGGGGAGGGYSRVNTFTVIPGNTYNFYVGKGGAAGGATGAGGAGEDSSFNASSTVLGKAGGGGGAGTSGTAGATTSSAVGDVIFHAGNGAAGVVASASGGGGGGAGSTGNGTKASGATNGSGGSPDGGNGGAGKSGANGCNAGSTLGGGGSGGLRFSGGNVAGCTGAQGQVSITYDHDQVWLTQEGYIFEGDDATTTADSNSQQAAASTSITSVKKGERLTVRLHLKNTGPGRVASSTYALFYDRNDGIFTKIRATAVSTTSAGNCTDTNWTCTAVDTANTVGYYTSLAFDPSGNAWVSYYDSTNGDLLVARYVGSGGSGCATSAWNCTAVDTANDVGYYSSLAFDPYGNAWVSYQDGSNSDLKVARYVGSGGSGCASSAWTCTTVDTTNNVGMHSSLAFDSSGNAWVSYHDLTNGDLRVARYVGSGGTGCASSAWTCTAVDTANDVGWYTSIAFDPSGNAWVSYHDNTNGDLRVARYVGSGGSGCASSAWTCTAVDTANSVGDYSSIAFDPSGNAWVSYRDNTNQDLLVARYVGSGGSGCASGAWTCTAVDTTTVGYFTSLAFDAAGSAWVSYYDNTNLDLRVANVVRSGEITISPSLGIGIGTSTWLTSTTTFRSHADMLSTTDSANRNDVDCLTAGATWNNGAWFDAEEGTFTFPAGDVTPQCTELAFTIDTSQASSSQTYRIVVATKDGRKDKSLWRGPVSGASSTFPTLTIESATTQRLSKDAQYALPSCADTAWGCGAIDTVNVVGNYNFLAFDSSGNAWVSYYDTTNGDLRVEHYVGSGGTGCASSAWTCTAVDTANDVGYYSSLAFDPSGNAWMSYYDATNGDLRVAHYVGSGGTGCASSAWTCTAVDAANNVSSRTSLAFDPSGNAWVSYYDLTNGNLLVARYVGSGGTGCASSAWMCTAVDTANDVGQRSSLAFDPSGNAWVSYYDNTNGDLRVAHYVGSSTAATACSGSTAWTCTAIDTTNNVGERNSLAFDPSGNAWVSYRDFTNGDLLVARYVGSGGTGCASSAWTCTAIDTANDFGYALSLAFDPSGNAWVSYYDNTNFDLRVARYVGSGGTGCASSAWTCTAVDTTNNVGSHTSIAFDLSGNAWVSYYDLTNGDLRVAKLNLPPTKLSANATIAYPGRSASHGDLRYRLDVGKSPRTDADGTCNANTDKKGYCGVQANDSHYDNIAANASETPMFAGAFRNANNTDPLNVTWIGQSTVAPSSKAITMQVYRFGTTNAWQTLTTTTNTCSSGGANTDCTLVGATTTNLSEYYDQDGANYWMYVRTYQAENDTAAETLKTNQFSYSVAAAPTMQLLHYRFRADTGSETAASFMAAEDTPVYATGTTYLGDRRRLRILVSNTGSADATNITYRLEYASSSCASWIAVASYGTQTTEEWVTDLSQWVPDGAVTTNVAGGLTDPGGKSFVAGQARLFTNQTTAHTLTSSQFTEHEFALRSTAQATKNLVYCFRLTNAGSITNFTYSVQPQITLNPNPRPEYGGTGVETAGTGVAHGGGSQSAGTGTEGTGSGAPHGGGGQGGGGGDSG